MIMVFDGSDDVKASLREFIYERFPLASVCQLQDADSLLASGVVDSLGVLDIVTHLETRFGILVDGDDLSPENFDSIATLDRFVTLKRVG